MRLTLALGLIVVALLPASICARPAAQPHPELPASEETGQLSIVSAPAAEVVWEGVSLGITDAAGLLVIRGIPPGTYDLVLRKPGYEDWSSQVEVRPGAQSVRLPLQSPVASARPPQRRREPEPRPAREPEPESTRELEPALESEPASSTGDPTPIPSPELAEDPASAAGQTSPSEQPSNSPSPAVYLLGLALLGTTGALAVHRWRSSQARAAFPVNVDQLAFEPNQEPESDSTSFLNDLRRSEVAMEDSLEAGSSTARPGAIDVEFKVIDLDPVEERD